MVGVASVTILIHFVRLGGLPSNYTFLSIATLSHKTTISTPQTFLKYVIFII